MLKAPCKDCPDRRPLCHAECERYLDFRKKKTEFNVAKYQAEKKDAEYWEYVKYAKKGRNR